MKLRVQIDEMRLDEEWLNQPEQVHHFSKELANARLRSDQAKADLDLTKAELYNEVSNSTEKMTEKAKEAAVISHPKHGDAVDELNQARHDQAVMQAAIDALEHRRRALENLVTLHGMNYYAEKSRVPEEFREKAEEAEKRRVRTKTKKKP